jgi:hypothetical protein
MANAKHQSVATPRASPPISNFTTFNIDYLNKY